MNTNDYKARSDQPILQGATNALDKIGNNPISNTIRNIGSWSDDIADTASMGVKLTLSTLGMKRSLLNRGAYSDKQDDVQGTFKSGAFRNEQDSYIASSQPFDRYDSDKDFYFRCGNYYMPLSIRFTLRAQKNFAESQLIDGPHIIERVSKAPKTIDVTVRMERKQDENPTALHIVNEENRYNPVPDISAMIQDLYERQDVFVLENPVLNGEHGVTHVVMREYTIIPGEGTTLMTLQMSLMEVDIKANIINNEQDNTGAGGINPDAEPLV